MFLVADTQLYKRLCPSVGPSVRRSVRLSVRPSARVEKWEKERFRSFLCMCQCWKGRWVGRWVWMGVGCPCPTIRNNIVTPRHLFYHFFKIRFIAACMYKGGIKLYDDN